MANKLNDMAVDGITIPKERPAVVLDRASMPGTLKDMSGAYNALIWQILRGFLWWLAFSFVIYTILRFAGVEIRPLESRIFVMAIIIILGIAAFFRFRERMPPALSLLFLVSILPGSILVFWMQDANARQLGLILAAGVLAFPVAIPDIYAAWRALRRAGAIEHLLFDVEELLALATNRDSIHPAPPGRRRVPLVVNGVEESVMVADPKERGREEQILPQFPLHNNEAYTVAQALDFWEMVSGQPDLLRVDAVVNKGLYVGTPWARKELSKQVHAHLRQGLHALGLLVKRGNKYEVREGIEREDAKSILLQASERIRV